MKFGHDFLEKSGAKKGGVIGANMNEKTKQKELSNIVIILDRF